MLSNLSTPRQTECRLSSKEDLPLRRREIEFLRAVQNGAPILLLREGPRHRQRAGHARRERNRLRVPSLRVFGWDVALKWNLSLLLKPGALMELSLDDNRGFVGGGRVFLSCGGYCARSHVRPT